MVADPKRFPSERTALQHVVESLAIEFGPGGIVAYLPSLDRVLLTDFYVILVLEKASTYLKKYMIQAITSYMHRRNEMPGAQVLDPHNVITADDIHLRSVYADKSFYLMDLVALSEAQKSVNVAERKPLHYHSAEGKDVVKLRSGSLLLDVSRNYYELILANPLVSYYTGVVDQFSEPTESWRSLPVESKGVFFLASETFYGIVMPHAEIHTSTSKN